MKINRYSAKCKLCKGRWTTELADRTEAFNAHESKCARYAEVFAKRRAMYPKFSEAAERYQMSALYFEQRRIEGFYVAEVKCDSHKETGTAQYDCKELFTGKKKGWMVMDATTASAMNAVYKSLQNSQRPESLAKFDNIPLSRLVDFCWKHVA